MRIKPAIKGLITAVLMIAIFLGVYYSGKDADPKLQYLVYLIYALGITWAVIDYRRSSNFTGKFVDNFGQGFRCFIIVVLAMALFYGIFNYLHPEFGEESAAAFKEQLLQQMKEKKILPTDIDPGVATYKKQYTLRLV
ncbi:MAG: DUF4199 domain-containing protein, partial [Ferruginibacter sp.]